MIAVDTTALSVLFLPGAPIFGLKTKEPVKYALERMQFLVERISKAGDKIIIPTPVLSELVVRLTPDQAKSLLSTLNASACFKIESFDSIAAIDLGLRTAKAIAGGDKKSGSKEAWAKIKFDRQIVTIAMVNGATEMISDDAHVASTCEQWGFKVTSIADLDLPPDLIPPPLLRDLSE